MKTKTSELQGAALDWAVGESKRGVLAIAYGLGSIRGTGVFFTTPGKVYILRGFWDTERAIKNADGLRAAFGADAEAYSPSTDWSQGGPIIEREGIAVGMADDFWQAHLSEFHLWENGPTPLIAAMRCYVASKLGDEVDVPEELSSIQEGGE
jgi:hypothetical protein